jgi:hypothetical protein
LITGGLMIVGRLMIIKPVIIKEAQVRLSNLSGPTFKVVA